MSFDHSSFSTAIRAPHVPPSDASASRGQFASHPDRYGVFAWWPDDTSPWIHPYDQPLAADYIPSDRVWQRFPGSEEYDLYCHGPVSFRAQTRMWLLVEMEGYWIGDWVEVLSQLRQRRPFMAQISEVRWSRGQRRFEYTLCRNGTVLRRRYFADTFRHCHSLTWWQQEEWRKPLLREATSLRIEPLPDDGVTIV